MKNFYYVTSFNLSNPSIKTMLDKKGITEMSGMMLDLKIRSKLFISYGEAFSNAQEDFEKKLKAIFPDDEQHNIRHVSAINPALALRGNHLISAMIEKFVGSAMSAWDDNCCGVLFFADMQDGEDVDDPFDPNSWMLKYEILY